MRSTLISTLATAATAAAILVPTGSAEAAGSCDLWRSTNGAKTGFARCTSFDGAAKYKIRVSCSKGGTVYSPKVSVGQTTWATCKSGYVTHTTLFRA
ncbi:hypothetical protein [Demetria terragena]|uniref:hypothetical protein n=1 Tax=Demetria terragena TaxID=63959 RepID=UPI00036637C6|nr:hypothetical protein [Demetria terragena]